MASTVQDIQIIRSLRKELRDPNLPVNITNLIENVHTCIKGGTDLNGWKKVVDWRGSATGGRQSNGKHGDSKHGDSKHGDDKHSFFNSRSSSQSAGGGEG